MPTILSRQMGVDPTCSGTASIITRSEMAQPALSSPEMRRSGVRDSSTTKFEGLIITWEVPWQSQWLSPDAEKHGKAEEWVVGAGNSNLKSDQSVDIITTHSFAASSQRSWLETLRSQAERIIGSLNGRVGSTSLQQCSSPSPIPAFPDPPRTKQCGGDDSAAERPARECAPNKLY